MEWAAFLNKQGNKSENFVALVIGDQIQAGIWTIEKGRTRVVSLGEKQSWDGKTLKELVAGADLSLSSAIAKLTMVEPARPEKMILGLPYHWTEEGKIKKERLSFLRQLSQKLSLRPMGFVVTTEALVHLLKIEEGAPPSVILIRVEAEKIQMALIRLGKILGIEKVARSDNLALDVEEGLLRFPREEAFPPRMLLYGEGDLEAGKQVLVSYPWQEPERKLPFLHFPRVEVAPSDFEIKALCLAGGTEIGKVEEVVIEAREQKETRDTERERKVEEERREKPLEEPEQLEPDLGFVVGKDILEEREMKIKKKEEGEEKEEGKREKREKKSSRPQRQGVGFLTLLLLKGKTTFGKLRLFLSKLKLPAFSFASPRLGVIGGVSLAVIAFFFWIFWTVSQAEITLFVQPEELKEEFELTLDPEALVWDEEEKILPAKLIEASVSQTKTIAVTGKKTVGEKAKGEVTIFNRTETQKTFPSGTVLVGPAELKFTLDSEVTVASKTPDLVSGVDRWGEAKVGVTATKIGAEYNLAADSQFSFEKFSSSLYLAKNTAAFSGGTSRQIQVVSEKDRDDLKKELEEELTKKAREKVSSQLATEQYLVEESLQTKITNQEFSRQVGEEAQELSLTLEIKATALVFAKNSLAELARLILKDKISNQEFRWEEAKTDFEVQEVTEEGRVRAKVILAGQLYPSLSIEQIRASLAGKSLTFQKNYLNSLPKVVGFETKIAPAFFARLGRLPVLKKNIRVKIEGK